MSDKCYFIRKGGYYYKPNSCGYTEFSFLAGLFTKDEADWHERSSHGECKAVHASECSYTEGELMAIRDNIKALIKIKLESKEVK